MDAGSPHCTCLQLSASLPLWGWVGDRSPCRLKGCACRGCVLLKPPEFSKDDLRNRSQRQRAGKGGVFRLDGNHMKEALEEVQGWNLTVWRVGAGRGPLWRLDGSWISGQSEGPGLWCCVQEALGLSHLRVPGSHPFPNSNLLLGLRKSSPSAPGGVSGCSVLRCFVKPRVEWGPRQLCRHLHLRVTCVGSLVSFAEKVKTSTQGTVFPANILLGYSSQRESPSSAFPHPALWVALHGAGVLSPQGVRQIPAPLVKAGLCML